MLRALSSLSAAIVFLLSSVSLCFSQKYPATYGGQNLSGTHFVLRLDNIDSEGQLHGELTTLAAADGHIIRVSPFNTHKGADGLQTRGPAQFGDRYSQIHFCNGDKDICLQFQHDVIGVNNAIITSYHAPMVWTRR